MDHLACMQTLCLPSIQIGFVIAFVVIFNILRQPMFGGKSKTANILTGLSLGVCTHCRSLLLTLCTAGQSKELHLMSFQ